MQSPEPSHSRSLVVYANDQPKSKAGSLGAQGSFNQCVHSSLLGMQQDGLFTEYADVPAAVAHRVNDIAQTDRDLDGLACVEPAAVAYLACLNARITPGESVAVLGAGPIGFYAALMAKTLFGASHVTLSEPVKFRREFGGRASDKVLLPKEFSESDQSLDERAFRYRLSAN